MSETQLLVAERVRRLGAAHTSRVLGVSRAALLAYVAGASREATRIVIEQRIDRLGTATPAPTKGT
jgi:hypothetical protein